MKADISQLVALSSSDSDGEMLRDIGVKSKPKKAKKRKHDISTKHAKHKNTEDKVKKSKGKAMKASLPELQENVTQSESVPKDKTPSKKVKSKHKSDKSNVTETEALLSTFKQDMVASVSESENPKIHKRKNKQETDSSASDSQTPSRKSKGKAKQGNIDTPSKKFTTDSETPSKKTPSKHTQGEKYHTEKNAVSEDVMFSGSDTSVTAKIRQQKSETDSPSKKAKRKAKNLEAIKALSDSDADTKKQIESMDLEQVSLFDTPSKKSKVKKMQELSESDTSLKQPKDKYKLGKTDKTPTRKKKQGTSTAAETGTNNKDVTLNASKKTESSAKKLAKKRTELHNSESDSETNAPQKFQGESEEEYTRAEASDSEIDTLLSEKGKEANVYSDPNISSSSEDEEADKAAEEASLEQHPLRYATEGFQEVSFSDAKLWLEDVQGKNKELWLIKIPHNCDPELLNHCQIAMETEQSLIKKDNNENEEMTTLWELSTTRNNGKQSSSLIALLPSKKDKLFHSAGGFAAHVTLTQRVQVPSCVMPQTGLKQPPSIPAGLKLRHKPFGADTPVIAIKRIHEQELPKSAKKKKKKKKSEESSQLNTSVTKKKSKKKTKTIMM